MPPQHPLKYFLERFENLSLSLEVQETGKRLNRTSALEEVVLEEFLSTGSATDVDTKADGQEGLEVLAEALWVLQAWSSVGGDQVECLEWLLVKVWRLGLNHLNSHDTQGPNVDLWSILLLLDNLRSHPVRCTDHGGTLGFRLGELGTETEVGNLDMSTRIEKDVIRLDITMDNTLLMQVIQSTAGLKKVSADTRCHLGYCLPQDRL